MNATTSDRAAAVPEEELFEAVRNRVVLPLQTQELRGELVCGALFALASLGLLSFHMWSSNHVWL